jgi:hypothetical protein
VSKSGPDGRKAEREGGDKEGRVSERQKRNGNEPVRVQIGGKSVLDQRDMDWVHVIMRIRRVSKR